MTCPPRTGLVCEGAPLGQADGQRETGPLACRVGTQAGASAIPKAEPGPCGYELVVVAKGAKIAGPQCPRQRESSRPFTSARLRLQAPAPTASTQLPMWSPVEGTSRATCVSGRESSVSKGAGLDSLADSIRALRNRTASRDSVMSVAWPQKTVKGLSPPGSPESADPYTDSGERRARV